MKPLDILRNGITTENPTFALLLGMCPTLATTTSALNGMAMGLATMFVLICSNTAISLIKHLVPDAVRIPSFIVVIAGFVTIVQMLMQAFVPSLYASLGLFIPLIVVNCIVLGRAEAVAAKQTVLHSALDGVGIGLGFTLSLTLLGFVREFLGICPFLGVSKKVDTALGMGAAVTFVLALSTMCTFLLQKFVLEPFDMVYMQTISFILVIAALVQMVEIILKKVSPALYQALGVFLPLITTNCCVLGVAILVIQKEYTLLESVVYAISIAIGFTLALVVFAGIREQLSRTELPASMKGIPIALISAGILAMAFMGFSGMVKM